MTMMLCSVMSAILLGTREPVSYPFSVIIWGETSADTSMHLPCQFLAYEVAAMVLHFGNRLSEGHYGAVLWLTDDNRVATSYADQHNAAIYVVWLQRSPSLDPRFELVGGRGFHRKILG